MRLSLLASALLLAGGSLPPMRSWDSSKCEKQDFSERVAAVRESSKGRATKRVLVTGAAGFIGSHVADFCANSLGFLVVAVDDLSGGYLQNVPTNTKFIELDLKDEYRVAELFRELSEGAKNLNLSVCRKLKKVTRILEKMSLRVWRQIPTFPHVVGPGQC